MSTISGHLQEQERTTVIFQESKNQNLSLDVTTNALKATLNKSATFMTFFLSEQNQTSVMPQIFSGFDCTERDSERTDPKAELGRTVLFPYLL